MNIEKIKNMEQLDEIVKNETFSRKDAIRMKCLDCCAYDMTEVRKCPSKTCPLWQFRRGRSEKGVESNDD